MGGEGGGDIVLSERMLITGVHLQRTHYIGGNCRGLGGWQVGLWMKNELCELDDSTFAPGEAADRHA